MEIVEVVATANLSDLAVFSRYLATKGKRNLFVFADGPGSLYWRFTKPPGISEYCHITHCGDVLQVIDYDN
ncbi:MAG: hypothetical protein U0641_19040 [Anaerolineae bacterium]